MFADISRDGSVLLTGVRVLAGEPLIPYRYLEDGNFIFITANDEMPFWSEFGNSQVLVYLSKEEIDAVRANPPTMADISEPKVYFLTDDMGFYLTTDEGALLDAIF